VSRDRSSIIVFPLPIDLIEAFRSQVSAGHGPTPGDTDGS